MLEFAVWGLVLLILLLWKINSKTLIMPVKGEELPCAAEEDMPTACAPHAGEHPLSTVAAASAGTELNTCADAAGVSADLDVKTLDSDHLQDSSEVNSGHPSVPPTAQKPSKRVTPMLSSEPEARERLKFILGASEDNSSDEEPLVTKPPSGAPQPPTSTMKSAPQPAPSVVPLLSSSGIK